MNNLLNPTLILWFLWSCISFRLLLVYLSHIWHISKQMPPWFRLCSMNSVLSSRSWLVWLLRKMPLTMGNQLLACSMRNGCKIQKIIFWHICKAVLIFFLHGQCFVECGFSVNKLAIDDNMQEKSTVWQLTFTIAWNKRSVQLVDISGDLRKSCLLASQRYKNDLEKINSYKKNALISHWSEALSCRK